MTAPAMAEETASSLDGIWGPYHTATRRSGFQPEPGVWCGPGSSPGGNMAAKKKSGTRKSTAKKKAAKTRKRPVKKAAKTRKSSPARRAAVQPDVADPDRRIAIVRTT